MSFRIQRADGRSNAQVIIDLVKDHEPGKIFTYSEICSALNVGTNKEYGLAESRGAVLQSVRKIEKLYKRTLINVPSVGYKLARANEHMSIACIRNDRANRQMRKGLHTLQNVRYEEMDANARMAHEGHLLITSAIYEQTRALEGRMKRVENAIKSMRENPTVSR